MNGAEASELHRLPLYGDGLGYVPDELIPGATTLVLMQNPGEEEEARGRPAVGKSGQAMDEKLLPRAGLTRGVNVSVANVLKCRALEPSKAGPRTVVGVRHKAVNTLPKGKAVNAAMAHCMDAHFRVPPEVDLIVAQGALAVRALGLGINVTAWRGYLAPTGWLVS